MGGLSWLRHDLHLQVLCLKLHYYIGATWEFIRLPFEFGGINPVQRIENSSIAKKKKKRRQWVSPLLQSQQPYMIITLFFGMDLSTIIVLDWSCNLKLTVCWPPIGMKCSSLPIMVKAALTDLCYEMGLLYELNGQEEGRAHRQWWSQEVLYV